MGGDRVWAWLEGRQKRVATVILSPQLFSFNLYLNFNTTLTPP